MRHNFTIRCENNLVDGTVITVTAKDRELALIKASKIVNESRLINPKVS